VAAGLQLSDHAPRPARRGPGATSERLEIGSEPLVEERPGTALAQPGHGVPAGHPETLEDESGQESRTIEPHPAMREDAMASLHERGPHFCERMELREVRKLLVEDREVDVEALVVH